ELKLSLGGFWMFGTLGVPEMMVIFILALLLFGPKKLPELGRTIGKAMTEFRRASNELKQTFDREMRSLEQETESFKQIASSTDASNTYNYDYGYESNYDGSYGGETHDSTAAILSTTSASAPEGAESTSTVAPEGTVAHGTGTTPVGETNGHSTTPAVVSTSAGHSEPAPAPAEHSTAEHKA